MFFSSDGILYENLNSSLKKGEKTDLNEFFDRVKKLNLRNSVFIDNTANNYVASTYTKYLKNNIHQKTWYSLFLINSLQFAANV